MASTSAYRTSCRNAPPMPEQKPKGNATVVDESALTPDERTAMECASVMLKADPKAAAVFVLKLGINGAVTSVGGGRIKNPTDLTGRIARYLGGVLQDLANGAKDMGEQCNCAKCIAERGGVFANPAIKAEA